MHDNYQIIANAVRLEYDENNDEVYVVFKIIDPQFKKTVREEWSKNVKLKIINNSLAHYT